MNSTFRKLFNLFRVMKIVILFMLIGLTHLSAEVRSQNASVSLKLKDATVEQVILEVEKQLKQDFFFSKKEVDVTKKISVDLNQATLDELVQVIFGDRFGYRIMDNLIVITPKMVVAKEEEKTVLMKGQVVDKGGAPLPGVTVLVEGTTVGCATDVDGKFSLPLPKEVKDVVVVFRFVGMETQELKITDPNKYIHVMLESSNEEVDEVVVTGYFKRKKDSYTGVATSFAGAELRKVSGQNVLTALSMIDPSFQLVENLEMGSDPNTVPAFQIRGPGNLESEYKNNPNTPTFLLDGFEVSVEKIFDIDPNRIANITVLKDAAATAIYGSRAANGVVVIETILYNRNSSIFTDR